MDEDNTPNSNDDIIQDEERHVNDWQESPNTQTQNSGKVGLIIFIVFVVLIILSAIFGVK